MQRTFVVGIGGAQRVEQRMRQRVVERIALVGAVHGENAHRPAVFDQQFGHRMASARRRNRTELNHGHAIAHSSLMPVAATTGAHLACSSFTNAAYSAGVEGAGMALTLSNCFFSSADRSVLVAALWSLSRMSAGTPAGRDQAVPVVREHGLETGLAGRRDIGQGGAARLRRHGERLDLAGADVRQQHRHIEHDHLHVAAEQVVHRGRGAAIGNVHEIDLGGDLEQFDREMRESARPRPKRS